MLPATPGLHFVNIAYGKNTGINTGLAIAFPSTSDTASAKGKLIHRGPDGSLIAEQDVVLASNGQLVGMVSELLTESLKISPDKLEGTLEPMFECSIRILL